ncbi:MAG: deoxyguanosinetriphosphate triphosphohydrolase, partial [Caldilineae bacterium]
LQAAGVETLDDLRRLPHNVATYSGELAEENRELKRFLYRNFYRHYRVVRMASKADRILRGLFEAFVNEPEQLPPSTQRRVEEHEEGLHRVVCDYIAGMTDRFASLEYRRLYDPEERV